MHRFGCYIFIVFAVMLSSVTRADWHGLINSPTGSPKDLGVAIQHSYIGDFPGERLSLQSQRLSYQLQDVRIPGPNGLTIEVNRLYDGRWEFFYPRISILDALTDETTNFGCIGNEKRIGISIYPNQALINFGFPNLSDVPSDTIASFTDGSILRCENDSPVVLTPNGVRYVFFANAKIMRTSTQAEPAIIERGFSLHRIADRFGNELVYEYESPLDSLPTNIPYSGYENRLVGIDRSDGASVNFHYDLPNNPSKVTKITYGDRSIKYDYAISAGRAGVLHKVTNELGHQT